MARPRKEEGIFDTTGVDETQDMAQQPAPTKKRPNDGLPLDEFTYKGEFIGKQWEDYCNLVDGEYEEDEAGRMRLVKAGLPIHQTFDFVGYKVIQMRKRLYPKSSDQTTGVVGFRIVQDEPVRGTHSTLKNIKQLNDQIHGKLGTQPMIYYLLKKY